MTDEEALVEASLSIGALVHLLKTVPWYGPDGATFESIITKGKIGTLKSVRLLDDADEPRIVYWVQFPWFKSQQPLRISDFEFLGESLHMDTP